MKLWDIAIRQPVFMTMILTAGVVLGIVSYTRMPVDLFPNVEFPVIVVTTVYPGASPEEVEDQITSIMEEDLGAIGGIEAVSSRSREGVSTLILQFNLDTEVDKANQEVRERVGLLRNRLPATVEEPIVRRFNPSDNPIMLFGVADRTGSRSPSQLRADVEDLIQGPLQRVPGVAAVEVNGGQVREIQVLLDPQALAARFLTPQQVIDALRVQNLNVPGGSLIDGNRELLVRTPGNFATVADIEDVIVSNRTGPVYLRDVAIVVDGYEKRESITRLNGEESVVLRVRKQSGTNTTAVANGVKAALEPIAARNPDLEIVIAGDESLVVQESTNGALEDLLWSALLATLVIFAFFRDIRNTLITMAGLPVIMIATLFFMDLFSISLNQISLLALALVVGLVIDDAIVVRENIMRWIERGVPPREAASGGTAEVVLPVIATSATILAVFLPVAYAEGIIGKFFRDFGLTVSIAIVVSTFESLTLAPMLSSIFFRPSQKSAGTSDSAPIDSAGTEAQGQQAGDDPGEERAGTSILDRMYAASLNWAMDHKLITTVIAVLVIAGSVLSAGFIEQSFLPNLDRGQFDASMELPVGTPLNVTLAEAVQVEAILRSHPEVSDVFTTVGGTAASHRATFFVKVVENGRYDTRRVIDELRGPLANVPNMSFQLADNPTGGDAILGGKDIIVQVEGRTGEYAELGQAAQRLAAELATIPGLVDIDVSYKPGTPELQLNIDRRRAADIGLTPGQIGSTVRTLVNGEIASVFRGEGQEANIRVRLNEANLTGVDDVLNTGLLSPAGQIVPLRTVATATIASGPNEIVRSERRPIVSIGANASGRSLPQVTTDVTTLLATRSFPDGISARLGGNAEAQSDSFRNLSLALLLAVVFIYMVLASQFASFIQPLLIMLAMPLAVIGAILALSLTGRPLDLTAFIGFIMLMGLVTKNSILLVDFANRQRALGVDADLAMRRAGPVRLRPILMTALSLILAMVPVAAGFSSGGEFRSSMSIAIMGGMITSTFLTLIIVPVGYSIVVGFLDRLGARVGKRNEPQPPTAQADDEPRLRPPAEGSIQPAGD